MTAIFDQIVSYLAKRNIDRTIVTHPRETTTIEEKLRMMSEPQYADTYDQFPLITIVQGSVLTYQEGEHKKIILYFSDGSDRISFNQLKAHLHLDKEVDIHFFDGNFYEIGLVRGAVSPLIKKADPFAHLYFDAALVGISRNAGTSLDPEGGNILIPGRYYDMAIDKKRSLMTSVDYVCQAMKSIPGLQEKVEII